MYLEKNLTASLKLLNENLDKAKVKYDDFTEHTNKLRQISDDFHENFNPKLEDLNSIVCISYYLTDILEKFLNTRRTKDKEINMCF